AAVQYTDHAGIPGCLVSAGTGEKVAQVVSCAAGSLGRADKPVGAGLSSAGIDWRGVYQPVQSTGWAQELAGYAHRLLRHVQKSAGCHAGFQTGTSQP